MAVALNTTGTEQNSGAVLVSSFNYTGLTVPGGLSGKGSALVLLLTLFRSVVTGVTVTWGGVPMTLVSSAQVSTPNAVTNQIWVLLNPQSGNQTAAISWGGAVSNAKVNGLVFTGVEQSNISIAFINPGNTTTSGSNPYTSSVTLQNTSVGNYMAVLRSINVTPSAYSAPNQTVVINDGANSTSCVGQVAPGDTSTTFSATVASTYDAIVWIEIQQTLQNNAQQRTIFLPGMGPQRGVTSPPAFANTWNIQITGVSDVSIVGSLIPIVNAQSLTGASSGTSTGSLTDTVAKTTSVSDATAAGSTSDTANVTITVTALTSIGSLVPVVTISVSSVTDATSLGSVIPTDLISILGVQANTDVNRLMLVAAFPSVSDTTATGNTGEVANVTISVVDSTAAGTASGADTINLNSASANTTAVSFFVVELKGVQAVTDVSTLGFLIPSVTKTISSAIDSIVSAQLSGTASETVSVSDTTFAGNFGFVELKGLTGASSLSTLGSIIWNVLPNIISVSDATSVGSTTEPQTQTTSVFANTNISPIIPTVTKSILTNLMTSNTVTLGFFASETVSVSDATAVGNLAFTIVKALSGLGLSANTGLAVPTIPQTIIAVSDATATTTFKTPESRQLPSILMVTNVNRLMDIVNLAGILTQTFAGNNLTFFIKNAQNFEDLDLLKFKILNDGTRNGFTISLTVSGGETIIGNLNIKGVVVSNGDFTT